MKVEKKREANVDVWRISTLKAETVKEPDRGAKKKKTEYFSFPVTKSKKKNFIYSEKIICLDTGQQ